ncbi:MAG: carboxypeptidase-like regulatory domain-containing protein [Blastocatellia bacterium]
MNLSNIKFIVIGGAIFALLVVAACRFFSGSSKAATGRGHIEGTVVDEQRRPLAEVIIGIKATTSSEPYPEVAPVTNAKGEFSFPDLATGQYTLLAAREGFREQTKTVVVQDRKTARVEFVLRK